uniref:Tubulin polyglutamylase TTLL4 n=1 Tax=Aceria tosichella TaxID=561515 RepID=A0A6G1SA67_9ACAR
MSGTTQVIHMQPNQTQNGYKHQNSGGQINGGQQTTTNNVTITKTHLASNSIIKDNNNKHCKIDQGPQNRINNNHHHLHSSNNNHHHQHQHNHQHQSKRRLSDERELVKLLASFSDRSLALLESGTACGTRANTENTIIGPPVKRSVKNGGEPTRDVTSWQQFYSFPRLYVPNNLINPSSTDSKTTEPFVLQPSLFHKNHVPPTVYFNTKLTDESRPPIGLPASLQHMFKWKISSITPNTIRNCVAFMKFEIIRQSNTTDSYYIGSWCKHMPLVDFGKLDDWRKVNHYPGSFHMGRKDKLWLRLRLASQKYDKFDSLHPKTFVLPKDYEELDKYWKNSPSNLFIMKPPASARGNGVEVINNISQIPESALKLPQQSQDDGSIVNKKSTMIVQQYISNPCLLENRQKFDLRIYVLVTSVDPLKIYVYDEGLVRFASSKYTSQEDGIIDQYMHLTNYFINKNNRDYQINNDCDSLDGCKWTLKRFWRYIEEHFEHVSSKDLWDQIIDIIIKTIICCETPMTRLSHANCKNDYSSYELFGFDIILDENFKPWILEVNITPSLKSESNLDTSVKFRVIRDMFNLVGYHLPPPPADQPNPMTQYENCRLFFDKRLYTESLTKQDKLKHLKYQKLFKQENNHRRSVTPQHALLVSSATNDQKEIINQMQQQPQQQQQEGINANGNGNGSTMTSSSQATAYRIQNNNDTNKNRDITTTKQDLVGSLSDDESSAFRMADDGDILSVLTQSDIRVLMLAEDELSRCGQFKRVYPSATSSQYLKYFDKTRYYNLLLDAWEQRYKDNRMEGIRRLSSQASFLD